MSSYHDLAILRSTYDRIRIHVATYSEVDGAWGRAWLEVMTREDIQAAVNSWDRLKLDPETDKADREEAGRLVRWIKRGWEYATQVSQIEVDYRGLYPIELARARLAGTEGPPLGTNPDKPSQIPNQMMIDLDRSMMKKRVSQGDSWSILVRSHALLRSRYPELEVR